MVRCPPGVGSAPCLGGETTGRIRLGFALDSCGLGGTELNAVRVMEQLDGDRYELHVLTLSDGGALVERFTNAGATVRSFPIRNLWGREAIRTGQLIRRYVREVGLHILHAQDHYSGVFTVPWATLGREAPVGLISRRWWHAPTAGHERLARILAPAAKWVVVNSMRLGDHLGREWGMPRSRIAYLPNFVEPDRVGSPTRQRQAMIRQVLGVPDEGLVIGVVARLDAVKDHTLLLEAVAGLGDAVGEATVVFVGDGPERDRLEAATRELGLAARVIFAGQREPAKNWHAAMDISVLCSRQEGMPNTLLEALAAGRPMVATAVGGVPEVIEDGVNGLLVAPGDTAALAQRILTLAQSPDLRARLGEAGLVTVQRRHSVAAAIAAHDALYAKCAPGRGASSGS